MQCVLDVVVAVDHPCAAPFGSRINDSLVRTRLAECVFYEVARVPNESEDLGAASATSQPDGSLSSHQQRPAMARSSIFYQSVCHSARESLARLANASGRSTVSQRSDTAALRRPSAKARCLGDAQRASPATGTSLAQACRLPRHSQITGESKKHFSPVTAALIVPGPVPETTGYSGSAENFRWWRNRTSGRGRRPARDRCGRGLPSCARQTCACECPRACADAAVRRDERRSPC